MAFYAHGINSARWLAGRFEDVHGAGLTSDFLCADDAWSSYLVNSKEDDGTLRRIALQVYLDCRQNYGNSITLLLLSERFLEVHDLEIPQSETPSEKCFGVTHYNIRRKTGLGVLRISDVVRLGRETFSLLNGIQMDIDSCDFDWRLFGRKALALAVQENKDAFVERVLEFGETRRQTILNTFAGFHSHDVDAIIATIKERRAKKKEMKKH